MGAQRDNWVRPWKTAPLTNSTTGFAFFFSGLQLLPADHLSPWRSKAVIARWCHALPSSSQKTSRSWEWQTDPPRAEPSRQGLPSPRLRSPEGEGYVSRAQARTPGGGAASPGPRGPSSRTPRQDCIGVRAKPRIQGRPPWPSASWKWLAGCVGCSAEGKGEAVGAAGPQARLLPQGSPQLTASSGGLRNTLPIA